MKSYKNKDDRNRQERDPDEITLSCLNPIEEKINLAKLMRSINVPKGTFVGWKRRGDNMLDTKNHISSDYRERAFHDTIDYLRDLRDEIDDVIAYSGVDPKNRNPTRDPK